MPGRVRGEHGDRARRAEGGAPDRLRQRCRASSRRRTRASTPRSRSARPPCSALPLGARRRRRARAALSSRASAVPSRLERAQFTRSPIASSSKRIREVFGGRMRMMITGAAPTAMNILEFFWAAGLPIYEAYGMTEATVVTHINRPGDVRLGTVGRVIAADGGEDRRRRRDPACAGPSSSRATSRAPRRAPRRWRAAGCTPATSAPSTAMATCASPIARST